MAGLFKLLPIIVLTFVNSFKFFFNLLRLHNDKLSQQNKNNSSCCSGFLNSFTGSYIWSVAKRYQIHRTKIFIFAADYQLLLC